MASRKLEDLKPVFRDRVEDWLEACKAAGLDILVYCTFRDVAEQTRLYKIGRTVKGDGVTEKRPMGRVVTNAKAGQSAHNYGLAIDFVPLINGKPQWSNKKLYDKAIALAGDQMKSLRPFELAHLEMPEWRKYI